MLFKVPSTLTYKQTMNKQSVSNQMAVVMVGDGR